MMQRAAHDSGDPASARQATLSRMAASLTAVRGEIT